MPTVGFRSRHDVNYQCLSRDENQLEEVAAETYGISDMTSEKYQELLSKGMITADMAQKALLEMQDKYKDATSNFSSTIGGMQRTLKVVCQRLSQLSATQLIK
ncbi:MAG: hypothetical protein ACLTOX_06165 [Streptococcus thermophilus]